MLGSRGAHGLLMEIIRFRLLLATHVHLCCTIALLVFDLCLDLIILFVMCDELC